MRTTVTLDPDVAARLKSVARERGLSFKEAINMLLRAALGAEARAPRRYRAPARSMGLRPGVDIDKALRLAAAMEDEETIAKLERRK